MKVIAETRRAH